MSERDKPVDASALRRQAEVLLREQQRNRPIDYRDADVRQLLHELQVHQIELELQNAELTRARDDIEDGLRRYTELYDFAPVAYLTLDHDFIIRQINLTGATLLGTERSRLIGRPFKLFVAPDDRSNFANFVATILASHGRETCEVALMRTDGPHAQPHIHIEVVGAESGGSFRVVVFDITEQYA